MKIIITLRDNMTKEEFENACAVQALTLSILMFITIGIPCAIAIYLKIHGG